ncbi:MAG: 6-bladed beta-propeller [Bacteroidota bacterium]|uniref:6-bladed beta-propeller protein n=2 Tax=Algoriphagus faecimaris TaxID=686796 RepID=A0A1G6XNV2_9BACT|nr:hypothetical protein SAMN04488104_10622 [Algoriphagus faecimaris]
MNHRIIYCLSLFLVISCYSEKEGEKPIPQILVEKALPINMENFEILDLVPLETTPENLMGLDIRLRMNIQGYYLMDIGIRDAIHHFSLNGSYLGPAVSVGEGPDQLKGLQDFQVDDEGNLFVLTSMGDVSKVFKKSSGKEWKEIIDSDYLASSFTILNSGGFLFSGGHNLPFVENRVILTDPKGNRVRSFLPNDYQNEMLPTGERNFFESENSLLYTEIFNNKIYNFNSEELVPILELDFGRYALPSDFWEKSLFESFGELSENGFAVFKAAFESEKHYLVNIHIQKNSGSFKKVLFIEKQGDQIFGYEGKSLEEDPFSEPVLVKGEEVIFLSNHSTVKKTFKNNLSSGLSIKLEERQFDYPVLIKAKLKDEI